MTMWTMTCIREANPSGSLWNHKAMACKRQSTLLWTRQQSYLMDAVALKQIEQANDLFVACVLIGGDHDGLLRILRLPVVNARDQLVTRDAYRHRRAFAQPKRLVRLKRDFHGCDGCRELTTDTGQLDHSRIDQRRGDHEDHQQHQHHVDVGNDVDLIDGFAWTAHFG